MKNEAILKKRKLKNHMLKKTLKKAPVKWLSRFNKLVRQKRFKIERTFRGIKRGFKDGVAR